MNKINLLLLTAIVAISTSNIDASPIKKAVLPIAENLLQRQPAIRNLYSKKDFRDKSISRPLSLLYFVAGSFAYTISWTTYKTITVLDEISNELKETTEVIKSINNSFKQEPQ